MGGRDRRLALGLATLPLTFAATWSGLAAVWAAVLFVSGGLAPLRTLRARSTNHG